ncbi:tail associated lysin [Bacillus phage TsarBomba]|uniref:Tapemeasure n=1 Tax=Bacillus phage TsarBomba TaxID=1690456 RepID=A0A0K2D039_9CAUD|nr:tail associated lysin [Bacillus phage TsarBomba]ALA13022.1 tapemeasure [Bacillus phage TsarBomba]
MANKEDYIISVDAEISKAVQNLGKIRKLMDEIEGLRNKGVDNYYTTSQKDMDKNMRSMKELAQLYRDLPKSIEKLQSMSGKLPEIGKNLEDDGKDTKAKLKQKQRDLEDFVQSVIQQQQMLKSSYNDTKLAFREMASFQQNYSKNFKHVFNSNDVFNLPTDDFEKAKNIVQSMANEADGVSSKLDDVVGKMREINKLDRRTESLARRASASKYMSFQQASNFRKDQHIVNVEMKQERSDNINRLTEMGMERSRISKQIKDIERNPQATQREIDKKIALQQTIEAMDKEWHARMELNKAIERTTANMEQRSASVQDVTVKPGGTMSRMLYERAPAIGLAVTGAMAGTVGSLYHQGASINKGMRDDEISIGQRIGMDGSQWRDQIRDGALNAGLANKLGMSGQEMIAFQDNYLSKKGYTSMGDLNTAMQNQAIFSRTSGVGVEDTKSFFNTAYGSGGMNGKQTKEFQNAFLGAIKRSGMEGREKDQLKALEGILDGMSSNRALSNQDVMNTLALQTVLSSSGDKSISGEKGGRLMQSLDQGIRQGFDNPKARLVFGQGTKYQGLEGMAQLQEQMEKGLSDVSNLDPLFNMAKSYGNGNRDAEAGVLSRASKELLGADMSIQQAKALLAERDKGNLNQKTLDEVMKNSSTVGEKISKEKEQSYKDSSAATDNQSDRVTEKQAAGIYDLGEGLREVNASLGGMPPIVYGAAAAIAALGVAAAGAAISFGASTLMRRGLGRSFGKGGGKGGGRPGGGGGGGATIVGGGSGGRRDRGGSGNTVTWSRGAQAAEAAPKKGFWSRMFGGGAGASEGVVAGGTAAAAAGGTAAASRSGGLLKGAGKVAGKALLPLAILSSVADIWSAPEGKKGEATGSAAGGLLGGIGGGIAAGAAAGTIVPGIGNVAGAIIGGVGGLIGGLAGSWGGGKIGSWFDSDPDKEKKEAAAKAKKEKEKAENKATNTSSITGYGQQGGTIAGYTATSIGAGTVAGSMLSNNLDPGLTDQIMTPGSGVNSTKEQVDKENTNTRQRTEFKKTDNLAYERENISLYEKVLQRADQLLAQARAQNGIMGNNNGMGGAGGAGSSMGVTGGGSLKLLGQGQKWQNASNLQQSDLGYTESTLTAADLDNWINSKAPEGSMMRGMGATFLKAGQQYGLDPRYLVAHAAEESAWGTSNIAKQKGNFFGIGAFDNSPMESAYEFKNGGGSAAENGIMGGAKWISEKYYGKGRTTLDKMHQAGYATNGDWASNIASIMKGAPNGSGTVKVDSTINVNVKGDESVSNKIKNSSEMKNVGKNINDMIYSSLNFYSQEMRRV